MTDYRLRLNLESAEETRDRLRRAAEAAEIGTFYCPLPLGRLYWNARCKTHFWLSADTPDAEVDIETFYRRIHPEDRSKVRAAVQTSIESHASYDVEYRTVSPEGHVRWLRAKGSTCFDDAGHAVRFDGITIDISGQKRLEAERAALMESEREQRLAAQSANEAKDAFVATVSHELRSPLTAILAWANLIDQAADDADFVHNGISVIRRNILTQTRLVDDLLDAARISTGKFSIERLPVSITACLQAALQDVRPIADEKGIFVADVVADEVEIYGDAARLRQVFGNLLSNALKHTNRGGKILPSLVADGNIVRVSIADTGTGIAEARLDDIFQPFVQVESPVAKKCGGLGLGLSIARNIVIMHGGEITVHSDGPGKGSIFTVILPAVGTSPAKVPRSPGDILTGSTIAGRTILFVEDDVDTLEALALTLQLEDAMVQTARSAEEARRAIRQDLPDVIVSDLTMPGESGYEFVRSLRQEGLRVPAVALTGHLGQEDQAHARAAGFDDYLGKPVAPAKLLEVIARLIGE
ncbi:ATP-binding protein [Paraburkholderia sp. BR14374]|uniref:hybrid sensor histidine kinase/response regulator n=1 Tax=Paraburkholderia sp. BR14374 TaxID=3237007 RepID=UPI0034CD46CC